MTAANDPASPTRRSRPCTSGAWCVFETSARVQRGELVERRARGSLGVVERPDPGGEIATSAFATTT